MVNYQRVQRIKSFIRFCIVVLFFLPTIISVILLFKFVQVENDLKEKIASAELQSSYSSGNQLDDSSRQIIFPNQSGPENTDAGSDGSLPSQDASLDHNDDVDLEDLNDQQDDQIEFDESLFSGEQQQSQTGNDVPDPVSQPGSQADGGTIPPAVSSPSGSPEQEDGVVDSSGSQVDNDFPNTGIQPRFQLPFLR